MSRQERSAASTPGLRAAFGRSESVRAGATLLAALAERAGVRLGPTILRPEADAVSAIDSASPGDAGRFEIVGEIARGGVGVVHQARDRELGRDVALKSLLPEHADRHEMIRRFIEEAQVGSQLQHPGIVPVYELGMFSDGRPFLAMKLVRGKTLAALLSTRRAAGDDRGRFVGIFAQVCQTMAYAHARGVIHRDLKPSNVMVGAFGEVQVMDWGLSKVLASGSTSEPEGAAIVETIRSGREGAESLVGSVMGTPAYMPPEQARGEVESLDERADVFSLGAILCEILTGEPPYAGEDARSVRDAASRGDLGAALRRIDASPFDAELKRLARECLAPDRRTRPRDAAVVVREIEAHVAAAEERVRAAELESAAARARAAEERRARRLTIALAGTIVLALVIAGGAAFVRQRDIAEAERSLATRVDRSLAGVSARWAEARSVAGGSDLLSWEKALAAADGAMALVADSGTRADLRARVESVREDLAREADAVRERAEREKKDAGMAALLEDIRFEIGDTWNRASTRSEERFTRAFRDYGIDVDALEPEEAARRIRESAIAPALVACLFPFGHLREETLGVDHAASARLASVARAAKTDPYYAELFRVGRERDLEGARALAASADPAAMSAAALDELAATLQLLGDRDASCALLRRASVYHSHDYWIQFHWGLRSLGFVPPRFDDALPALAAAVALRPLSAPAWITLGQARDLRNEPEAALVAIRRALEIRPDLAPAHAALGVSLSRSGRASEAEASFREAVRLDPDDTVALANWGDALSILGRTDEAIARGREAVERRPSGAKERGLFGSILLRAGRPAEAVESAKEALRLDPVSVIALDTLALGLHATGDLAGSAEAFKRSADLQPHATTVRFNHGLVLSSLARWQEAAAAFDAVIRIDPGMAEAHNELGVCLNQLGRTDAAVAEFREAIRLGPEQPHAYVNLADIHVERGRWTEALTSLRVGCELSLRATGFGDSIGPRLGRFAAAAALVPPYSAILTGELAPRDASERLVLAYCLRRAGRFAAAAREYEAAFAEAPERAEDLVLGERLEAARAAAGAGLEERALEWLEEDLAGWKRVIESDSPPMRTLAFRTIDSWRRDAALAPLREAAALPDGARAAAARLWASVDAALAPTRR